MTKDKCEIISICETRPEVLRVMHNLPNHIIINTGQHYDYEMDEMFWKENKIRPNYNLDAQTFGDIYDKLSDLLRKLKPKIVIIYGDTRSSLAGAIAAKDNDIKVAHLEAGTRCYNMDMPEERNRIMIDTIADILFAFNEIGKNNLLRENTQGKIFIVGDILYDKYLENRKHKNYIFLTIHRKENQNIFILKEIFNDYKNEKIIFPVHPVMIKFISKIDVSKYQKLKILKPLNYSQTMKYIKNAKLVISDSGGIQREAFFMGVPCKVMLKKNPLEKETSVFGYGDAKEKIKKIILDYVK